MFITFVRTAFIWQLIDRFRFIISRPWLLEHRQHIGKTGFSKLPWAYRPAMVDVNLE